MSELQEQLLGQILNELKRLNSITMTLKEDVNYLRQRDEEKAAAVKSLAANLPKPLI